MSDPDLASILAELPHGAEFRFIDEILTLIPGQEATATYTVKGDEDFLAGHFPDAPMMPGVILIEALAQLGGILAQTDPEEEKLSNLRLTAVQNAKILGTGVPGDCLQIEARLMGRLGNLFQVQGRVSVQGGAEILKASVALSGS